MPAATVGAAYSEGRHVESARKTYDSATEQTYRKTVNTLTNLAGLDLREREMSSPLEKQTG